jgi:perosamine synthetase
VSREPVQGPAPAALAIEGGAPTRAEFLPYARQTIEDDDVQAVVSALTSDWLTTGPRVDALERAFADRIGTRHAIAYSSGTAALHGAAFAARLGPGDEVAVPTLTPRTRAVVVVHYGGVPADVAAIGAIADRAGLVVIEDAAHAVGARVGGRSCGAIGAMGVFSLHPAKQLTAGEGGIVTTDSAEYADRLRRFRNHCMDTSGRERESVGAHAYSIDELGFNYRLTDVQAALGLSQLRKLDRFLARRAELVRAYDDALAGRSDLVTPVVPPGVTPAWHLYAARLSLEHLTTDRDTIFRALRAENIGVKVHYIPIHLLGFYRRLLGHSEGEFPVAEDSYRRLLTLPLFASMTTDDVDSVVRALAKVLAHYAA